MGSREVDSRVCAVNLPPTRPVGGARASPSSAACLPIGNDGSSGDATNSSDQRDGDARSGANMRAATAAIPRSLRPIRVPSSSAAALPPVPPSSLARAAMASGGFAESIAASGGGADLDGRAGGLKLNGQNDGSHIRAGDAANLSFGRWCSGDAVEARSRRSGCSSKESSDVDAGQWRGDDDARAPAPRAAAAPARTTVATATTHGDASHGTREGDGDESCGARGNEGGWPRGGGGAESDAAGGTREEGRRGEASEHAGARGRGGMGSGPCADSTVDVGSSARGGGGRGAWQFDDGVTGDGVWPVEQDALWAAPGGCAHRGSARGSAEERGGERVSEKSSGSVWWVEKEMCRGEEVAGGGGGGGEVERRARVDVGGRADASAEEREYSLLCHSPRYAAYRDRRSSAQQVQASASSRLHEAQVRRFRSTLRFLGLDTSSCRWAVLTWGTGVALLLVVPCGLYAYVQPADDLPQHQLPFQLLVLLLHNSLGVVAFLFLRAALRTHGLHAVLFLDSAAQEDEALQAQYLHALQQNRAMLLWLLMPLFLLHLLHKALLFACIPLRTEPHLLPPRYHVVQLALLFLLGSISWLFAASTFLFTCVLFSKACSLQELKMQGYRDVVQRCSDPAFCFFEYTRISAGLAGISRRFRLFLLLAFAITLLGALASMFHMVQYRDGPTPLSFLNSGHLIVSRAASLSFSPLAMPFSFYASFGSHTAVPRMSVLALRWQVANVVALVGTGMCLRCASKLAHLHRRIVRVAAAMHAQHTFDSAPLLPPTPSLSFPPAFPPPFAHTAPPALLQPTVRALSPVNPIAIPPRHSSPPSSVLCPQPSLPAAHPSFDLTTAPCADLVDRAYTGSPCSAIMPCITFVIPSAVNALPLTLWSRPYGRIDPLCCPSRPLLPTVNFLSSSAVGISVYGFVLDRVFIHTSVGALLTTTWFILGQSLSASFKPR
ncbi:unnamed protein product [Closterium sp. Naga37s-1]|nr:unnamed protein product [Closterium sp. Naga37s-1]